MAQTKVVIFVAALTAITLFFAGPGAAASDSSLSTDWTWHAGGSANVLGIHGDDIYVSAQQTIFQLDRESGEVNWEYSIADDYDWLNLETAPVYTNGTVIFSFNGLSSQRIWAVDEETGEGLWEHDPGAGFEGPTASGNAVYLTVSSGFLTSNITALDVHTGQELFSNGLGTSSYGIAATSNAVFVAGSAGLLKVSHLGEILWSKSAPANYPPIVNDERVIIHSSEDPHADEFSPHFIGYDADTGLRETATETSWDSWEISTYERVDGQLLLRKGDIYDSSSSIHLFDVPSMELQLDTEVNDGTYTAEYSGDRIFISTASKELVVLNARNGTSIYNRSFEDDLDTLAASNDQVIVPVSETIYSLSSQQVEQPPSASFAYSPNVPEAGEQVTFNASESSNPEGEIGKYKWDFDGDGTTDLSSTTPQATHTYESAGTYNASLTVTEPKELENPKSNTTTLKIPVEAPKKPTIGFSPANSTLSNSSTQPYDLIIRNISQGIGAFDIKVGLNRSGIAQISDIATSGISQDASPGSPTMSVGPDNMTATASSFNSNYPDTGAVTIATVNITGMRPGTIQLSYLDSTVVKEGSTVGKYNFSTVEETMIYVLNSSMGPITGSDPPTDPDEDGVYEDFNGDGQFNILDVRLAFVERDSQSIQDNANNFDVNGDGRFGLLDVRMLFLEV